MIVSGKKLRPSLPPSGEYLDASGAIRADGAFEMRFSGGRPTRAVEMLVQTSTRTPPCALIDVDKDGQLDLVAHRAELMPVLAETYGAENAKQWFHRWRMFFLACAELFAYQGGEAWQVTHHRLKK